MYSFDVHTGAFDSLVIKVLEQGSKPSDHKREDIERGQDMKKVNIYINKKGLKLF